MWFNSSDGPQFDFGQTSVGGTGHLHFEWIWRKAICSSDYADQEVSVFLIGELKDHIPLPEPPLLPEPVLDPPLEPELPPCEAG